MLSQWRLLGAASSRARVIIIPWMQNIASTMSL